MSFSCDIYYGATPEGKPNPNYGKILMAVAGADGTIAPEEWHVLEGIAEILGIPRHVVESERSFDYKNAKLESLIGPEIPKRALVYDVIRAAGGDGVYSAKEKAKAHKAAQLVGVSEDVVKELEQIVAEEDALRRRKAKIIFPGGKRA